MATRLDPSVWPAAREAARVFIQERCPAEADMFELVADLVQRRIAELDWRFQVGKSVAVGFGMAEEVDLVSPTVLMACAILFTRFPLAKHESFSDGDIKKGARQAALESGAGLELAKHVTSVAVRLYRLPLAADKDVARREERYEVWLRDSGEAVARPEALTWEDCERLRADKERFALFVDLSRKGHIFNGSKPILGTQAKHKQLLVGLLLAKNAPVPAGELYEGIWLKGSDRYGARGANSARRIERVRKAFRSLRRMLTDAGLNDVLENQGDKYRYKGAESFCVISEKPTVHVE